MAWISQHKLLFALLIFSIVVSGWYGLFGSNAAPPLLTNETVAGAGATPQEQQLVGSLLTLRAVTLSGTIFENRAFDSLRDFGTPIVPEPVGRENPFAPLGNTPAGQ